MSETTDALSELGGAAVAGAATGGIGWLAAVPALWKLGSSLFQNKKANALDRNRPAFTPAAYSIPPEVQEYLDKTQKRQIDPNLPGQSMLEQKLGAQTSNATSAVMNSGKSSGDIVNTIAKIVGNQNDAQNDVGLKAAQNYQNLVQKKDTDVASALMTSAGYKDHKYSQDLDRYKTMFQLNELEPFNQATGAASALRNASGNNAYSGINDLSTIATLMSMIKKNKGGTSGSTGNRVGTGLGDMPSAGEGNFV